MHGCFSGTGHIEGAVCWEPASCKSESGFTLFELIIVVVLIGMLLVVSVPTMRDTLIDDPLQASARKIIGYVRGVRDKAVQQQEPYLLYIDFEANRLWYQKETEEKPGQPEFPETGGLKLPEDVSMRDLWSRSAGMSGSGVLEVWISRQGYVDESVLHLEDDDGEQISLLLAPFLPTIEVRDGYHEVE